MNKFEYANYVVNRFFEETGKEKIMLDENNDEPVDLGMDEAVKEEFEKWSEEFLEGELRRQEIDLKMKPNVVFETEEERKEHLESLTKQFEEEKEDRDVKWRDGKAKGLKGEYYEKDERPLGFAEVRRGEDLKRMKEELESSNYQSDNVWSYNDVEDPFEQLDYVSLDGEESFLEDMFPEKEQEALDKLAAELHAIDTPTMGVKEEMEEHIKKFGRDKTNDDTIYDAYIEKLVSQRMEEMEYDVDGIDEEGDKVLEELISRRADYGKEEGWAVEEEDNKVALVDDDGERENGFDEQDENHFNTPPHGDWAETIVRVDRTQKVTKGGTIMTHRCLMICGNGKGAGGFGVGKGQSPKEAMLLASRNSRKNLTLVDRYDDCALTHDTVGQHNGCKVVIRAVPPGRGMKGSALTSEILYQCGISDASVKSYGNRNPYSVVMATFKALRNHEGIESVARKRGKRIMSLTKAFKLGLS